MSEQAPDHRNHAGPYGFTRREITALAGITLLSVIVIIYSEWRDRRNQTPGWVIEDVLIDAPAGARSYDSPGNVPKDSISTRPTRDYSDLIDINTADVRELSRLPGIGAALAQRIIAERESNGVFVNLTDLQRVHGIGARKAATLSGWVRFSGSVAPVDTTETP
jgi:competence ComEA-like helix-hairpin-helix protein